MHKNIVRKTPMPGWSDSQPLPVGNRLYTICEPDFVVCLDAHTGKILWQDRLSPGICEGLTGAEAKKHQEILDIARAAFLIQSEVFFSFGILRSKPPGSKFIIPEAKATRYIEQLRRLSARMQEAEDDPRWWLCPFGVADITDPAKPKLAANSNLLGGEEMPADIFFDRYLGYTPDEKGQALKSAYPGMARWFGVRNNGVFASGNRIFLQSAMAAYCVGDPAVKFHWNAASHPESVARQLTQL